jgi:hypothetical protein
MATEVLKGSLVAFAIVVLSLVCGYGIILPAYYFAAALAAWMLYSVYRICKLLAKRPVPLPADGSYGEALAFWLAALGSSLLAPLLWMLAVYEIGAPA